MQYRAVPAIFDFDNNNKKKKKNHSYTVFEIIIYVVVNRLLTDAVSSFIHYDLYVYNI